MSKEYKDKERVNGTDTPKGKLLKGTKTEKERKDEEKKYKDKKLNE